MEVTKRLDQLYLTASSPGSLGGVDRLYQQAKKYDIERKEVVAYLQSKDAYTQHKPVRRKFQRRQMVCVDTNDQHQIDLVDMQKFSEYNNGVNYLLTAVDCFSRYAWAIPVQDKTSKSIIPALTKIYEDKGAPFKCQSDKGSEFTSRAVRKFFKDCNVIFFTTKNDDVKCSMVERLNRTIKNRLWVHMTETNSFKYIDILQDVVKSYNNSIHSSTNYAPSEIGSDEATVIRQNMIENQLERQHVSPFKLGDHVRLAKRKLTFEKGYETNFDELIYKIIEVKRKGHAFLYRVEDLAGEDIDGLFYAQELSRVIMVEKPYHHISQILRQRQHKGNLQYLVRWYGYPSAYDSWENADELQ